ncbi:MAG TPA: hypothetical protein DCY91_23275 [Cyanobacteria bacterium UBA11370]|nr:hypothetical protein [Cyanobacteria bacterium UBA11370]
MGTEELFFSTYSLPDIPRFSLFKSQEITSIIEEIEYCTSTPLKNLTNCGASPQANSINRDEKLVISENWQDWLTVLGYLVFLGFIAWRVLATRAK